MTFVKRLLSFLVVACILAGLLPLPQPAYAANDMFNPGFSYNSGTGKWDIDWTPIDGTVTCSVTWHAPNGSVVSQNDLPLALVNGKHRISLSFQSDHIYDLAFSFKDAEGNEVSFKDKYGQPAENNIDTVYFISDITFEGTSFNDTAVLGGLADGDPILVGEPVTRVISGHDPKITLRWKVPTIWEESVGGVLPITHKDVNLDRLESAVTPHVDLDYCYFHINMNQITDIVVPRDYRTTLNQAGTIIVKETGDPVSGFDQDGDVTNSSRFVSFTLDQSDGILPGTEYEKINIRLYFWNKAVDKQATSSRLIYGYGSGTGCLIENKDNIFQTIEGRIDSLYTPMRFELSKVDIDKLEVRIYKIDSKNYTELYYQVREAGTIIELLEETGEPDNGIKVPDSSIPNDLGYGSIIIEIPLNPDGGHPERYYRVVVTDGNSHTPLGSLAIDLRLLGNDTGKPPVPREIQVQPIYAGKEDVVYQNPADEPTLRIPVTDLRISFEKPLLWRIRDWADIRNEDDSPDDFTFHLLLNTYLSDDVKIVETRVIGDEKVTVFVPVKEKRVLTIGKKQLQEDPNNKNRLIYVMDGSNLFYDFHAGESLGFENNEDYDINGKADYPTFLIPNTKYYLRMFSTRAGSNDEIEWSKRDELDFEDKISYISPVVSFTTYPAKDMPVPLPNLTLGVDVAAEPDENGKPVFNGITVAFPKILDDNDWANYTEITTGRRIVYDLYMSESTDDNSFVLLEPPILDSLETVYPDENPDAGMSALISQFPAGVKLKPNTTYYFKAKARLFVNTDEMFLTSDESPVKSITTPKTDSGNMDDLDRLPRTPVEFSIARNENGELELTDAKVTLVWLHAEQDVVYEMVCTQKRLDPEADPDDYINDAYHIGDGANPGFLRVYQNYKPNSADNELVIDVLNTTLTGVGFSYNENNTRIARLPINLPFLKPNHLYYFSIRAVRNRGTDDAAYSRWVSIPVTTKMVAAPDFFEAVNDVQLGFNVNLTGNIRPEDVKIMLKKGYQPDSAYVELSRAKYSVVKDGNIYYIRIYDLEANTVYDIRPFYSSGSNKVWYDSSGKNWSTSGGEPIQMKTRNTLNEIEVRFSGENLYEYFLEVRTDDDEDYVTLEYSYNEENSDYGYTLSDGTRIRFYREKTAVYVADGETGKYVYYAKISQARRRKADGTYKRAPLLSNTRYYIKVWARNIEDSAHIGPVTVRTDFSQSDYDDGYVRDEIKDMFESKADGLTKKLYFTVNEPDKTANRVLLKGTRIASLMQAAGYSGVIVDISKEKPEASKDIIIIPWEILDTLIKSGGSLTIRLSGAELSLTRESFNADYLKQQAAATGIKETMLELTVERKKTGSVQPPQGFTYGSPVYDIGIGVIGSKRTYAEINKMIYDILKEPSATGPFKYGLFDRELTKLLEKGTTLTYKSQVELDEMINRIIDLIEEELSMYIKDMLDGGRGLSASIANRRTLPGSDGGMKLKILHDGYQGLASPYVLPAGQAAWTETSGIKAWVFPYLLFTVKASGQYTVFLVPMVNIPAEDGFDDPNLRRLAQKYDLQKIFGRKTLYPGDYVTGDNAVNLFEVFTETSDEVKGMSTQSKIRYYKIDDIIPAVVVQQNINRQQAISLMVEIYAYRTGVSSDRMRPATRTYIRNADSLSDTTYHRLIIAVDLGIAKLEPDNTWAGERKATVAEVLDEIITVLKLLGEW